MVIVGWRRSFTILGVKLDECLACGATCEHVVGRKTYWGSLFWIPILFLGFAHGMACSACGTWTGIRFARVRAAMRSGLLPLDRARPHAQEALAAAAEEGKPPLGPAGLYDRLAVNPKRGPWDAYLKAYPVLLVLLVAASTIAAALRPPPPVTTSTPAHACWEDASGTIVGCRMLDGEVVGTTDGTPVTCYFAEPMREGRALSCHD